jgi:hypothetical protein
MTLRGLSTEAVVERERRRPTLEEECRWLVISPEGAARGRRDSRGEFLDEIMFEGGEAPKATERGGRGVSDTRDTLGEEVW